MSAMKAQSVVSERERGRKKEGRRFWKLEDEVCYIYCFGRACP